MGKGASSEKVVREIHRRTRRRFSAEEKIRIILDGLRGEESIAELCRREGLGPNLYYRWSKEFLEAGKKRLLGDTTRHTAARLLAAVLTLAIARSTWGVEIDSPPIRSSQGNNMDCVAQNLSSSSVSVTAQLDNGLGTIVTSGTLAIPAGEALQIVSSNTAIFGGFCRFTFDGDPAAVRGTVSREDAGGSDTRLLLVARALPAAGPAVPTLLVTPPLRSSDGNNLGCIVQNLSAASVQVITAINDGLGGIVTSVTFAVPAGQVLQLAFSESAVFGGFCTFQFEAPADQVRGFASLEDKGGSDTRLLIEATLTMSAETPATATPTVSASPTSMATAATPTPTSAPAFCCGDCNGDGVVSINELITAVNNALNMCPVVK